VRTCVDLARFVKNAKVGDRQWLKDEFLEVYVRRAHRIINGQAYESLDIGNINGSAFLTKVDEFLKWAYSVCPWDVLYVESAGEGLANHLAQKPGWQRDMLLPDHPANRSFYQWLDPTGEVQLRVDRARKMGLTVGTPGLTIKDEVYHSDRFVSVSEAVVLGEPATGDLRADIAKALGATPEWVRGFLAAARIRPTKDEMRHYPDSEPRMALLYLASLYTRNQAQASHFIDKYDGQTFNFNHPTPGVIGGGVVGKMTVEAVPTGKLVETDSDDAVGFWVNIYCKQVTSRGLANEVEVRRANEFANVLYGMLRNDPYFVYGRVGVEVGEFYPPDELRETLLSGEAADLDGLVVGKRFLDGMRFLDDRPSPPGFVEFSDTHLWVPKRAEQLAQVTAHAA